MTYLKSTLVAAAAFIVAVLLLTVVVDPYGTAPVHLDIARFNAVRVERARVDRLVKPYDILIRQPKTLLVGTSRVKEGLDPTALDGTALAPAYNAGIDFLNVRGSVDLLRFVLPHTPSVRRVFFEINFEHFYGNPPPPDLPHDFADAARDYTSMFLSYSAINAALRTVAQNKNYNTFSEYLHPDGLVEIWPQDIVQDSENFLKNVVTNSNLNGPFVIGQRQVDWFATINALCAQYRLQCVYVILPYIPLDLARWALAGQWEALERLKQFMVRQGRVWDFTLYSPVTDYRDPKPYWFDVNHFNHEVGAWALKIMAGERPPDAPPDFGVELTEANLPAALARWREGRDRWLAANPLLAARIRDGLPHKKK